jgi:hypothetical protein
MNGRIREIAVSAGMTKMNQRSDGLYVVSEKTFELFANELIQECMSIARGMRNPSNLNYKPSERFVDELRLHFGVES